MACFDRLDIPDEMRHAITEVLFCHRSMLGGGIAGAVVANSWEGRKPKRRPLRFRVVHRRVYTGRSGPAAF